jgi:hypothetical protein
MDHLVLVLLTLTYTYITSLDLRNSLKMVEFEFDIEKMKAGVRSFLWCDNKSVNQRNQDLNPALCHPQMGCHSQGLQPLCPHNADPCSCP